MPDSDPVARLKQRLTAVAPSMVDDRISRLQRMARNRHRGGILWLTGLSGAGKTTLSTQLERALLEREYQAFVLDGDELRRTLCADLGFSAADRSENIRRAGAVAALFAQAGIIAIAAFISPYRADRDRLRALYGDDFHEIWLSAALPVCEGRDVKGLYARARRGELAEFTGVSAPYEPPHSPHLVLDTGDSSVDECVAELLHYVEARFRVGPAP
jgi:bifunctional enzyme CysN/CysC